MHGLRQNLQETNMTFDDVRAMAARWPGVEEATSYGTPALKVRGKLLTRLREDGDSLVVRHVGFYEREILIEAEPKIFYVTDHYRGWPMVLVRLSAASPAAVRQLLFRSWREIAPRRLVKDFDAGEGGMS